MSLSAFIITRNEEADIEACLESLRGLADEIIVVDDFSTDRTVEICRRSGAKISQRRLTSFGAQKQFALDQAGCEWALSIDADECVGPELAAELRAVMIAPTAEGYEVRRNFYFLGRRLRHGGLGKDWVLRLFRRTAGRFTPVAVHESIQVTGTVARLSAPLEHYSYASIEEYNQKCDHYTTLAAQAGWERGRRFSVLHHARPAWEIFKRVVLQSAWLDGQAGLFYAALSAHAAWLRLIKLWALEHAKTIGAKESES